jgi:hypothetical protein
MAIDFMTASIKEIRASMKNDETLFAGRSNGTLYSVHIDTIGLAYGYRFVLMVGDQDFEGEFDNLRFLVGWLHGMIEDATAIVETYEY